jgi:transporter family-2 protein
MLATNGLLIVGAILAGALLPLQALVNGRLGQHLGEPTWAAALQNVAGALAMLAVAVALRPQPPSAAQLAAPPLWAWAGGAMGAAYVLIALIATPRLGAGPAAVAIIAGQLAAALLFDHFGVLHARKPIDLQALGGIALVAAGAVIILRRA